MSAPAAPPAGASSSGGTAARDLALAQEGLNNYSDPQLYAGRYQLTKQIGKGAYGAVYSAVETFPASSGLPPRKVAIKHIVNAFVTPTDARRIYREIKVQAHFNPAHPNILPLLEVIKPRDALGFTHIYLVSELMETDLHRVVHSRQDLTSDHISYFIYQTLCALQVIHSAHILHRDLKPSNLLANADCCIKMCDFGLARESDASMSQAFTEYVVTRWYRAPEVLLSGGRYTGSIDVWSVGCILGELLLRRPLFPGEHYLHQLQLITEILGSPSEEDLAFVTAPAARTFMVNLPKSPGVPFSTLFPHVRGPCLDLLRKMLIFEPSQRITVAEALEHPFLARVRAARRSISEESTPVPRPFKLRVHGGSSALKAMTVDKLKERFYAELCGLAMTPTPSTPSPHGATALFATLAGAGGSSSSSSSSSGSGGGASSAGDLGSPPVHSGGGLGSLPRPAAALSPPQASKLGPSASTTARPHTSGALGALPGAGPAGNPLLPFGAAPRGMPGPLGYGPPRGQGSGAGAGAGGAVASATAASLAAAATAGGLARGGGSVGVNVFLPRGGALPFPRVPGGIPAAAAVASPPKGASAASSSGEGSPGLLSSRYTAPGAAAPAPGEFLRNRYGMGLVGGSSSADTGAGAGSAPGSSRERSSRRGEEEEAEGEEEGEEEDDEEYGDEEDEYDYGDVEEGTRTLGGIKEASKEGSFDDSMVDSVEGLGAGGEGGEVVGGAPRVGAGVGASAPSRAGFSGMFGAPPPGPSALPQSYRQPSAAGAAASNAGGALSGLVGAPRSQAQAFLAAYGAGGTSLTPPRTTHTHAPSPPLGPPPPQPATSSLSLRASMASLSLSNASATPPKAVVRPSGHPGGK